MRLTKFSKLMLAFVLFLFAITTTGIYTWAPVFAKNLEHHHDVSISVEAEDSSHWSLIHHDQEVSKEDTKNHNWKSYDEPTFHHSVKPMQSQDHLSGDPVFFLSYAFPLILLFLSLFEKPIRAYTFKRRIFYLCNSYTFTKELIVLRN
ncbi:hypothetical protein [Acinetobacter sp. WU_MDCI_Abxc22]|uniref:hypothetical protein n=1 Tax=Acinetobacter sp. WU_MDCI_Abxc22 TaxID=2850071 RepID=UPI0021CD1E72|nr:hypothetical protein [Acinetobacter sp. WU_MDCI_Abxc22]MCU4361701.1 hypothetical protein [Acinetobacter sp. WU_MDCI_Abxc22]